MGRADGRRRTARFAPVIIVLAAGLAAGWLVGGGSGTTAQADEPVQFTPAATIEAGAFTPQADIRGPVTFKAAGFGGSGSSLVCDRERLIGFLRQQPDRLRLWARIEAVPATAAGVARFIRSLRPATVLTPMRVTDHTLVKGQVVASQEILATGTAVLVDDQTALRVRCRSGTPLQDPILSTNQTCRDCPSNYRLPVSARLASTSYAIHPSPPRVQGDPTPAPGSAPPTTVTVEVVRQLPPDYVLQRTDTDSSGKPRTRTVTVAVPAKPGPAATPATKTVTVPGPTRTVTVQHTRTVQRTVTAQAAAPRTVTQFQTRTVTVYEGAG